MVENKLEDIDILLENIIEGIHRIKGKEIVLIDLTELSNSFCDRFLICHGDSTRQVTSISDSVVKVCKENMKTTPWHKEGYQNAQWILLDYGQVIVHIFQEELRRFYQLEDLWADGKFTRIGDE